ncbi:MAG: hypothetical protein J1E84_01765 [Muribaculaceae bacterium]|nr:hypothetical protein [Muribaculaceae bacterium]
MSKYSNTKNDQEQTSASIGSIIGKVLRGQVISVESFARYWYIVLLAIVIPMTYITTKYECQTKMEEIRRLERDLEIVKTERIRAKSHYMSRTRESSMNQLLDSMHLQLHVQDTPPFKISAK